MERTVRLDLGERGYDVRIGPGMLDRLGATVAAMGGPSLAVVVSDSNVAATYGRRAVRSLEAGGITARMLEFPAGEASKTLATYGSLMDGLFGLDVKVDRQSVVVAVGGGVSGDIAGFVAATALRGLRWLQCPTTLLAAVDASVGGKNAVDHPAGKNLIGTIHQPSAVLVDVDALATLPDGELAGGLAECVKHALIADGSLLDYIERHADDLLGRRSEVMTEFIARNVAIKAAIVVADERETGQRALLNLGHTFAHAIETFVGYDRIGHGQAVSLGLVAACGVSARRGMISDDQAGRVRRLLERLGLPTSWPALDGRAVLEIMRQDKKSRGGVVRLVLPVAMGEAAIFADTPEEMIRQAVKMLGR